MHKASVLIVDNSRESREVLRTALERRGLQTWGAEGPEHGLALARRYHPDLIVLDLEASPADGDMAAKDFQQATGSPETPLIVLGTARRQTAGVTGEFVAKPYHYAPLVHKIEQLLESGQRPTV